MESGNVKGGLGMGTPGARGRFGHRQGHGRLARAQYGLSFLLPYRVFFLGIEKFLEVAPLENERIARAPRIRIV